MPQCSYKRSDDSHCPEERFEESEFCLWHDEKAPKNGDDIKARLEEKVKRDPNCEGYKLKGARLHDIWLTETNFDNAVLSKADLSKGHLFGMSLRNADAFKANCSGANLRHANMTGANVLGANWENARLGNIDWGEENIIQQEIDGDRLSREGKKEEARAKYKEAEEIYLSLKTHFDTVGDSKSVGVFFYREMIVQRMQQHLLSPKRFFMKLADVSCGYGEKVGNILYFSVTVIMLNAVFYSFGGIRGDDTVFRVTTNSGLIDIIRIYLKMLYYSTVTFTTLGYGDYVPASMISRFFAGIEAFMGAFLVALFVITVYKNLMSR
ncbi:pentapeptide repeat-containing protein [candidate division KSB1 bacterium]